MRSIVVIFLLVVIRSFGQGKVSELRNGGRPTDSLPVAAIENLDSLPRLANRYLDSLAAVIEKGKQKLDSVNFVLERTTKHRNKIDSLSRATKAKLDSLFSNMHYASYCDSINAAQKLNDYRTKLTNPKTKLAFRIDTLSKFSLADSLTFLDFSRFRGKLDTVNSLTPDTVQLIRRRLTDLDRKISTQEDAINRKTNDKLSLLSENGGNLPATGTLSEVNLNTQLPSHPDIQVPKAPVINLNGPTIETSLRGIDLQQTDLPLDESVKIPEVPNAKTDGIRLPGNLPKVQDKLSGLIEAKEKINGYQKDLKNLREGDLSKLEQLPDAIESRVENLEELKPLKEASQQFDAIKEKWNDPQVMKELALNKAKETAVNHFAGHEKELNAAIDKLSKLKAKIPDPEGTIDMFAKRQKFMKEKSFIERMVPGIALQFQKQNSYWLDINPYVGFKISGYWLAGLGWNERIAYNVDEQGWDAANRVYGLRSFLHFKLKNSLWAKAEVENMNAPVHPTPVSIEITGRDRIWSYFAGLKKDFQFSPHLKATVQTLYNVYNPGKRSPYTSRLNVRMGFEFPIRKSKRPNATEKKM